MRMSAVGWSSIQKHLTLCDFRVTDSVWLDAEHWRNSIQYRCSSYCTANAHGATVQFARNLSGLNGNYQVTLELGRADIAMLFFRTFGGAPLLDVLQALLRHLPGGAASSGNESREAA